MSILRSRLSRRSVSLVGAAALVLLDLVVATPAAHAADPTTVTILGTSDVKDSGLITPLTNAFQAAYPQFKINYIGSATGLAIQNAEAGSGDGLIVHAASSENNFVADGYSEEAYGRALFYGDYVLLGPKEDPAGVLNNGATAHDIAAAFEKVAAAGAQGKAQFESRTNSPGTAVAEHAIWALTTGVNTCPISNTGTLGGGSMPCTDDPPVTDSTHTPDWYHLNGATQAQNVQIADACTTGSGADCYVLTDRGTYENLKAQNALNDLGIVVRGNDPTARGGVSALINSFHGYVINPKKFPDQTKQTVGATDFLNFLTSPAGQDIAKNYLPEDGAPFLPSATPKLTASKPPASITAGKTLTITGSLSNVVPGSLPMVGKTVRLMSATTRTPGAPQSQVAQTTTNSTGHYTLTYKPVEHRTYSVATDLITQTEVNFPAPTPDFSDILQPATTTVGTVRVAGLLSNTAARTGSKGHIRVNGTIAPTAEGSGARLGLYARRVGHPNAALHYIAQRVLSPGTKNFDLRFPLPKGKWQYEVHYVNAGYIDGDFSATHTVTSR